MKSLTQTYHINAPISLVWKALTDQELINAWGAGPAKMSEKEGFAFSLWGGDIYGKNTRVIKGKELMQEWFSGNWENPSVVVFSLEENNGNTIVTLYHKNIPDSEVKGIEQGWKDYYMSPLKAFLENR